jgi:hypothetical protein
MASFARTQGANARAGDWEDLFEEQPRERTGSWLPLDALDDQAYLPTPQLRAMPAPRRAVTPGDALPERRKTAAHPMRVPRPARAASRRAATRGLELRSVAVLAGVTLAALAVYVMVSMAVEWVQVKADDFQYGRPRTMQVDAFVGHGETEGVPTHFVAMNVNRRVTVLEFPGGDATKATAIVGPYLFGEGEDLTPVQASVQDVNADAKPDLVLTVKNEQLIYLNDGSTFTLMTPEQRLALQKTTTAPTGGSARDAAPAEEQK